MAPASDNDPDLCPVTTKQPQVAYCSWLSDQDHACCAEAILPCIAVSIMDALDTKKPNAISLLGKELVVWRDDAGQWACMDDQCSHRLAPLSGLASASPEALSALAGTIPAPYSHPPASDMPNDGSVVGRHLPPLVKRHTRDCPSLMVMSSTQREHCICVSPMLLLDDRPMER